ncbi:MAG: phosphoglycolate phosphatase [Roseibaca calidilacus]|uniref:phosphoglycolate phosphatase n=1 Tax=Roseibaca calidilacus TaxID=1666912 RepID=A0A0N8K6U0_9RHOB|nr:HAD family hydrolase [Roseibaca calidilacus]KPP89873.1 MAG: phosphoglycolate phosphatase [Roseibaca calidilacus]CUX80913.1 phosphoglycolate phosphatase [Roseibaca calidilacus]
MHLPPLRAVLFDKDGTLFDFAASWAGWMGAVIDTLSEGDLARAEALAQALRFDRAAQAFDPSSPVIAGTLDESAALIRALVPAHRVAGLERYLIESSAKAQMVPPVPLDPLLAGLRARGLVLGVATNDAQDSAHAHLHAAGIAGHFAHVLGFDSGYTPKPAPDMLLGFAARAGLPPESVAMVGDSTHDLLAGRAAGMVCIAVLTGMADEAALAPYADLVLPDIGHLPDHIA